MTDFSERSTPFEAAVEQEASNRQTLWKNFVWLVAVVVSWGTLAMVSERVWFSYQQQFMSGRICGTGLTRFDPLRETAPAFCGLNLLIWGSCSRPFPRRVWSVKLPALLALVLWIGVGTGIYVGRSMSDAEFPVASQRQPR